MSSNKHISSRVAGGVVWMVFLRASLRVLGLVSTMVLARLLTPEDFGIVAIVMSFYALLMLFKNFGFDTAIIQMTSPERRHYDTAWTFNFIFGVAFAVILVCCAELVAGLYDVPEMEELLWTVAILFFIGGVRNVGTLDFRKNLTFDKEFKLKILPKLIGVPSTIILALYLRSYWALVIGTIVTQFSSLCIGYLMHHYRPRFALSAAGELFNFSKWLLINNGIYFINSRSPELFIGKIVNPQAVGFFSLANEIATVFTTELSAAVSRASYPGYAKVANDPEQLKGLYLNVIGSCALLLFPAALGIASLANLMVPVFLGQQWLEAIPILQIMAIGGLLIAINSNAGYVFMAMGNPRMSTVIGAIRLAIFIPALILLTNSFGLIGAAWSMLLASSIMFFVVNFIVVTRLSIRIADIARIIYRPAVAALVMLLCLNPLSSMSSSLPLAETLSNLALGVLVGAGIYFMVLLVLWLIAGRPVASEAKLVAEFLHRRRSSK